MCVFYLLFFICFSSCWGNLPLQSYWSLSCLPLTTTALYQVTNNNNNNNDNEHSYTRIQCIQ